MWVLQSIENTVRIQTLTLSHTMMLKTMSTAAKVPAIDGADPFLVQQPVLPVETDCPAYYLLHCNERLHVPIRPYPVSVNSVWAIHAPIAMQSI